MYIKDKRCNNVIELLKERLQADDAYQQYETNKGERGNL